MYLGGEKLKIPVLVLLFTAGLLIHNQSISAQDAQPSAGEPFRAVEQTFILDDSSESAAPVAGPSTWAVVRMVLTLALAAVAIYGVVFFIKRSSKQTAASDPFLKILATAHLGSNRYAHIVSVGSKAWLLGSSDGGVNLIGEVDDKDVINAMLLEDSRKSAETPGKFPDFLSLLRRMGLPAESRVPGAEDIRKRRERLKKL